MAAGGTMKNTRSLLVFVALVVAAAAFGGYFQPGAWYAGLRKPPPTPPNWVFGPAWTLLYLAIAVAGWIVWRTQRRIGLPLLLWGAQLALNAMWSFLLFGMQRPGFALVEIAVLLGANRARSLVEDALVVPAVAVAVDALLGDGLVVVVEQLDRGARGGGGGGAATNAIIEGGVGRISVARSGITINTAMTAT